MPVTDDLVQRLKNQLLACHGYDGDEISKAREQALNYYFQRARGDEVVGRSAVVSGDVSAMVEATLAQMVEAFSSSRICEFEPLGDDDEDQAQLESDAVQWFVMGRENGFLELVAAIKEALLLRNGIVKIEAEDRKTRRTRRFGNVQPAAFSELVAQPGVVSHKYDADSGELTLTVERTVREFRMQSVPLENFLYYSEWHRQDLGGIPICAERHLDTRAELIALGFPKDKVKGLTAHRHDLKTEAQARDPKNSKRIVSSIDKSQDKIEWYECYVRLEAGDGADELHRIALAFTDGVILEDVTVPFVRFAAGTAILNPHRFTGISLFDKLKQNQDIRTALRRALLDNVNTTTKNRLAYLDEVANVEDVSDGRPNGGIRVRNVVQDVRQAVMALTVPDTSANILANLESTARERSEMGGSALDLQTAQMQIGGERMGSQGLDRAYSVAEQLSASMMKTIAATLLRSVFLLAHATLREYFDDPVPVKRNGKWEHVKPSQWKERHAVTVKPGMSPGERTRRVNSMGEIINAQLMLADKGMDEVLVNLPGFNRALLDWARLAEVQNPEQYFVDPESPEAMKALQSKQKQAAELDAQRKALMQQAFGLEQLRTAFEKYRTDAELQFKYWAEVLGAEVKEAELAGRATTELVKAKAEGANRAEGNGPRSTAGNGAAATGKPAAAGNSETAGS